MELLEERTLLATFVVTTADVDGGNGSLRDAIQDANSNPGLDLIHFNIPSATVTTDANGHVDFSAVLPVAVANRRLVSATATDPGNNTSQFSRRLAVS